MFYIVFIQHKTSCVMFSFFCDIMIDKKCISLPVFLLVFSVVMLKWELTPDFSDAAYAEY